MSTTSKASTWEGIAARKRAERASRIPSEWTLTPEIVRASQRNATSKSSAWREAGILTPWELSLTDNQDATSLVGLLTTGAIKSEDVVRAFCKRAAIAQQLTNCLTEIMFDQAMSRARELDSRFKRTGKPVGPLHGLPISMKDTFKLKGFDSSIGIAGLCFKPATQNAVLVDLLLELGAVIHVKTNVPQTMMALDSHNNVFGRTLNPANNLLTAGGSSGGEGALIAMGGSVLGIGTDVGGSIRIPAACNGLFGVKPSIGFVPYAGQEEGSKPGAKKLALEAVAGPIAASLRDCEMFLRVIAEAHPGRVDPEVAIGSWKGMESLESRPLRIGIVRTDSHVQPLPPVQNLMEDITRTLSHSKMGIEVVEVDASGILPKILKAFNGIISIDGANSWFDHLDATGEPLSPWLQGRLIRRPQKSLEQVRDLQAQKIHLQTEFLHLWRTGDQKIDAMILPLAPHPILPIDRWNTVNYTAALNLLDLSTGVLPVRDFTVQDSRVELPSSKAAHAWEKTNREHWTKVDRSVYVGSPLSIQVFTPRLRERKLVEIMNIVDTALAPLRSSSTSLQSKL